MKRSQTKGLPEAAEFETLVTAAKDADQSGDRLYAVRGRPGMYRRLKRTTQNLSVKRPDRPGVFAAAFDGAVIELEPFAPAHAELAEAGFVPSAPVAMPSLPERTIYDMAELGITPLPPMTDGRDKWEHLLEAAFKEVSNLGHDATPIADALGRLEKVIHPERAEWAADRKADADAEHFPWDPAAAVRANLANRPDTLLETAATTWPVGIFSQVAENSPDTSEPQPALQPQPPAAADGGAAPEASAGKHGKRGRPPKVAPVERKEGES